MSVQPAPNCGTSVNCPGFNASCFGDSNPAGQNFDYLDWPTAQGNETFPALVSNANVTDQTNLLLNGENQVNGFKFPSGIQYTAYTPASVSTSSISLQSASLSVNAFNNPITVQGTGYTSFNAQVFSGGANITAILTTGSGSAGQPFSVTQAGSGPSGAGVGFGNVPYSSSATSAITAVFQPNVFNPNFAEAWTGTVDINFGTKNVTVKTLTGDVNTLVVGSAIIIRTPAFNTPNTLVILSVVTSGCVYSFSCGAALPSTYYSTTKTNVPAYVQPYGSVKFAGTCSIVNSQLVVSATTRGAIEPQTFTLFLCVSGVTVQVNALVGPNTYSLYGIPPNTNLIGQQCYGYLTFNGPDALVLVNNSQAAVIRGGVCNFPYTNTTGTSGSQITLYNKLGVVNQYPSATGSNGLAQTTNNYPVGLVAYSNPTILNYYASILGKTSDVQNCANTGTSTFTPTVPYVLPTTTSASLGGLQVQFFK